MLQVNQVDGATGIPEDHNQGLNESHRGTAAGPESLGTKGDKAGSGLHKAGQGEGKAGAGGYKAGEGGDKGGEYEVGRGGGGVSGGEGDSEAEEGKGSGVKQSTDLIVQTVPEVRGVLSCSILFFSFLFLSLAGFQSMQLTVQTPLLASCEHAPWHPPPSLAP